MGIARHTLRAVALPDQVRRTASSPRCNRALVAQQPRTSAVSCARCAAHGSGSAIAGLNRRGRLRRASPAGDPPTRTGSGGARADSTGGLLGVSRTPELACTTVRLEPGDLLVLYTDGIEQPGATAEERVLDVVGRMAGAGPQDVIDALVAEYRKGLPAQR